MKLKTIYQTTLVLFFSITIGVSSIAAGKIKTLSADEIKQAFVGNTMDHEKVGHEEVYVFWASDGTIKGKSKWGGASDTGKYTIGDNGTYCLAWNNWGGGKEQCSKIAKASYLYARIVDGQVQSLFEILKGNPFGL